MFCALLVYFVVFCYILCSFDIFCGLLLCFVVFWVFISPVLVCCNKKILATLVSKRLYFSPSWYVVKRKFWQPWIPKVDIFVNLLVTPFVRPRMSCHRFLFSNAIFNNELPSISNSIFVYNDRV
jgi:hypothetical protein